MNTLRDFVSRDLAAAAHLAARDSVEAAFDDAPVRSLRRHNPGTCNNPTCGCADDAEQAEQEARDSIIADVTEVADMIGCLNREDDARFSRAIQLALQGDAIASAELIRKALEREISYRVARKLEGE